MGQQRSVSPPVATRFALHSDVPKNHFYQGKPAAISSVGLFFDLRPAVLYPAFDLLLVPFAGLAFWTLATPSQLAKNLPDLPQMKCHAQLPTNHPGNSLEGPQIGFETRRRCTRQQNRFQLTQLFARQFGLASRSASSRRRFVASRLPQRVPATGRLTTAPQLSRDLRLRKTLAKQLRGLQPNPLLAHIIAAAPPRWRIPFQVGTIPSLHQPVTTFCEVQ